MTEIEIVAGWVGPIQVQFKADNAAVDLTGATVTLALTERTTGASIDTSGDVAIDTAASGIVSYTPDSADLVEGTYNMRWKVVLGGQTVFFPSSVEPDLLLVGAET